MTATDARPDASRDGDTAGSWGTALDPVLEAVRQAPSVHNTQPWRVRPHPDRTLTVSLQYDRTLTVADPQAWGATISVGCAVESIAELAGIEVTPRTGEPTPDDPVLATVAVGDVHPDFSRRMGLLRTRSADRAPFLQSPPRPAVVDALVAAAGAHGVRALTLTARRAIGEVADIASSGSRTIYSTDEYRAETLAWMRPRSTHAESVDGLTGDALRLPPGLAALLQRAKDSPAWDAAVGTRVIPRAMAAHTRRGLRESGLHVLLLADDLDVGGRLAAGRAMMALWMAAHRAGLAVQPVSDGLASPEHVTSLLRVFGAPDDKGMPFVLLRLGYATGPAPFAGRRPTADIVEAGEKH